MYTRTFTPNHKRNSDEVPVEYFGDSFSPEAFKANSSDARLDAKTETDLRSSHVKEADCGHSNDLSVNKTIAPNEPARKFDIDDLMLIGLLLLFLYDAKSREDLIIPVALAAILLF